MTIRKAIATVAVLACIAAGVAIAVGRVAWTRLHEPYKGYASPEQFVTIQPGSGAGEIGRQLVETRVISDARLFRAALWWTGRGRQL